jgi:hypothetical protein
MKKQSVVFLQPLLVVVYGWLMAAVPFHGVRTSDA